MSLLEKRLKFLVSIGAKNKLHWGDLEYQIYVEFACHFTTASPLDFIKARRTTVSRFSTSKIEARNDHGTYLDYLSVPLIPFDDALFHSFSKYQGG
jgi:urease accessory protein UreH